MFDDDLLPEEVRALLAAWRARRLRVEAERLALMLDAPETRVGS